jgi:hypothetical protein
MTESTERLSLWERTRLFVGGLLAAWALWNAANVYLMFAGERQHRLETAMLLLVAFAMLAELAARALRAPTRTYTDPGLDANGRKALAALAVALWLANWVATIGVPFLSDDYVLLARYRDSPAQTPQQFFRPVFGAVFWAVSWVGGESTLPFRLLGGALHVASAMLASGLVRRVAGSPTAATIAFVVFLLNPLQAETVVWIAGLQEALWTFLALSALAVHGHDEWPFRLRLVAVAILSGLAFGTKETAACLVILLPGLDLARRRPILGRNLITYAVVGVELAAYLALRSRYVSLEPGLLVAPTRYVAKQFVTLPYQLYMQPWSTAAVAMPGWVSFTTAALGLSSLAWTLLVRRRWKEPAAGAFVILASTLPLASYFFVRDDLAGARYLYFGAFGWALLVSSALAAAMCSARALGVAAATIAVGFGALLHVNLRPWQQAADVVRHMESAAGRGENPVLAAERRATDLGVRLVTRDGVPRELGGVGLFVNGYAEFLARVKGITAWPTDP